MNSIDAIIYEQDAALKAALKMAKDFEAKFEMHAERSRRIAMEFKLYKVSKGDMA